MAINKKEEFKKAEIELANFAKALSHPARIAILSAIAKKDSCICGELVNELPLAQSTVSQHLKELKSIGLIKGTIEGATSCYCIDWKTLEQFSESFSKLLLDLKNNQTNNNCC